MSRSMSRFALPLPARRRRRAEGACRYTTPEGGLYASASLLPLPVDLGPDLEEPGSENIRRAQPRRTVGGGDSQYRRCVEQVVDVEHALDARAANPDDLGDPYVELVQSILEHRLGLDQRHAGRRRRARREV